MPVTGSSFALSWPMVHDGEIRRSEEEFSDVIWSGISPAVWRLILDLFGFVWVGFGVRVVVGKGLFDRALLEFTLDIGVKALGLSRVHPM